MSLIQHAVGAGQSGRHNAGVPLREGPASSPPLRSSCSVISLSRFSSC